MNFFTSRVKTISLLIVLSWLSTQTLSAHKMILCLSTPRSLSTVFLRMMSARGDCAVFNEPGIATWHRQCVKSSTLAAEFPESIHSFEVIQNNLTSAQKEGNVFVKEMFFAAREYLLDDDFIKSPDCYVIFLVRNPHHVGVSNAKKLTAISGSPRKLWDIKRQVPDHLCYSSLYMLYEEIYKRSANKPYVVIAEELVANPREVAAQLFLHLGLPMTDACFAWESLGFDAAERVWNNSKTADSCALWHDRAMQSTGFGAPSSYKVDAQGNPTFEEITDPELRGAYRWEYYYNLMFYQKFIALAAAQ